MAKTATEVVAEIFAAGELDADCEMFTASLRAVWEAGEWSDQKIGETLRPGQSDQ